MADKNSVSDWDATPGNNDNVGGIPLGENVMLPSQVNNAFREMMSQIRLGVGVRTVNQTWSGINTFSAVPVLSGGGITFPATAIPSANANTLDEYEEGTWTPSFTFDTPGNLNRTLSTQVGNYTKIGNKVKLSFSMATSTFLHTTASGNLAITGVPFAPKNDVAIFYQGSLSWGGITKAGYTQANVVFVSSETTTMRVYMSGSGVASTTVLATDMPTAGTVLLRGTITYLTAS